MHKQAMLFVFLVFVLIIGAGLYAVSRHTAKGSSTGKILSPIISPSSSPSVSPQISVNPVVQHGGTASRPITTAQQFYDAYTSCLAHPPNEAQGQVSVYCQSHNPYASSTFQAISQGADPIVCAQNPPQSIKATTVTASTDNSATVQIDEQFGTSTVKTQVALEFKNDEWTVVGVTCPHP